MTSVEYREPDREPILLVEGQWVEVPGSIEALVNHSIGEGDNMVGHFAGVSFRAKGGRQYIGSVVVREGNRTELLETGLYVEHRPVLRTKEG